MRRRLSVISILALLLQWSAVCAWSAEESPFPLKLALQWLPQSQFAGYYIARDRGFYRDAGLEVTLIHTGPGPSSLDYVADGKADFATMFLADAIVKCRAPVPLAQVAQILRRSNLMLVAWKNMGIEKPSDLDGQLVTYWPSAFSAAFETFFSLHGIRPEFRPQNYTVNLFLHRGVAACAAMFYNEYHKIYQAGVDNDRLTVFMMRDYGLGFPEDGIYAPAETAASHPEICAALRHATLAGWEYAGQHRDEAVEAVLRESRLLGVPANRPHTRWMLDSVLLSIFPADNEGAPGRLDSDAYSNVVETLVKAGLISGAPPFEIFAPLEKESP